MAHHTLDLVCCHITVLSFSLAQMKPPTPHSPFFVKGLLPHPNETPFALSLTQTKPPTPHSSFFAKGLLLYLDKPSVSLSVEINTNISLKFKQDFEKVLGRPRCKGGG